MNASILTSFQRCPRIQKLQDAKTPRRWRPRELAEIHIRSGILALSAGAKLSKVSKDIVASFLEQCATPGLDVDCDPFTLAQDWIAILANILEYVPRGTLPKLKLGPAVILPGGFRWEVKAFADETGHLHRWVLVDRLDDDSMTREFHSWHVDGDRCAAKMPLTLHVIEIGRNSGNHQSTPWCRIFKHPEVINRFAFQQKDGTPLQGNWKPSWFQDSDRNKSGDWVDLMIRDNVKLIRDIQVKQPTTENVAEFVRQVTIEHKRFDSMQHQTWRELPMFRPACDLPPCCYRTTCFSKTA